MTNGRMLAQSLLRSILPIFHPSNLRLFDLTSDHLQDHGGKVVGLTVLSGILACGLVKFSHDLRGGFVQVSPHDIKSAVPSENLGSTLSLQNPISQQNDNITR